MGAGPPGGQRQASSQKAQAPALARAALLALALLAQHGEGSGPSGPWETPETSLRDYAALRAQLVRRHGWGEAYVDGAVAEYLRFGQLLALATDGELTASTDVDHVWTEHILDTESYALDSQSLWGRFLHHRSARTDEQLAAITQSYALTKQRYMEYFGSDAPANYWGASTQASSTCSSGHAVDIEVRTRTVTTTMTTGFQTTQTMTTSTQTTVEANAQLLVAYLGISLGGAGIAAFALACTHRCVKRTPPESVKQPDSSQAGSRAQKTVLAQRGEAQAGARLPGAAEQGHPEDVNSRVHLIHKRQLPGQPEEAAAGTMSMSSIDPPVP